LGIQNFIKSLSVPDIFLKCYFTQTTYKMEKVTDTYEVLDGALADDGARGSSNRRDSEGWIALMFIVDRGLGEAVRLLLDKGTDMMARGQQISPVAAVPCRGHRELL
jgi:hypothetical protein